MSGGHFDYQQHRISEIADSIEREIRHNEDGMPIFDKPDGWSNHSPEVLDIFKEAVKRLKEATVYAQRIDWYLSGDDGEETLIKKLKEDLEQVKREVKELENNNWYIGVKEPDRK